MEALIIQEFEPVVKQSGLEKANQYAAIFAPFMITLKQLSDKAGTINKVEPTALDAKLAREVRLTLAKNRTATEKEKDKNKASLLAEGNLIQNLNNIVVNTSKLIEADLDAIEKYAENKEKERKALLAIERSAMFNEFNTDLTGYDLGGMADNVFADLLESQKLLHEKRLAEAARIEAEKIEAERLELERQKAIQLENERLKKEAEEKTALRTKRAPLLQGYIVFIRDYNAMIDLPEAEFEKELANIKIAAQQQWDYEDKQRKEKAEADRIAFEESEKLAKESADKMAKQATELKAAQDAASEAAKELQDKKDAEAKAAAEKLAAEKKAELEKVALEKKAAAAPDKEKLKVFLSSLQLPVLPSLSTDAANTALAEIRSKFTSYINWAIQQVENL